MFCVPGSSLLHSRKDSTQSDRAKVNAIDREPPGKCAVYLSPFARSRPSVRMGRTHPRHKQRQPRTNSPARAEIHGHPLNEEKRRYTYPREAKKRQTNSRKIGVLFPTNGTGLIGLKAKDYIKKQPRTGKAREKKKKGDRDMGKTKQRVRTHTHHRLISPLSPPLTIEKKRLEERI